MTAFDLMSIFGMLMPSSSKRGASSSIDGYGSVGSCGCSGVNDETAVAALGMNIVKADIILDEVGSMFMLLVFFAIPLLVFAFCADMIGAEESIAPDKNVCCCCCGLVPP